jgi:thymidylate kinase
VSNIIIEGVDRLGKGTLIKGLENSRGAHTVIHYEKPKLLDTYVAGAREELPEANNDELKYRALELYQRASFKQMFTLLNNVPDGIILDRAHLGEVVYSHRYRNYDGGYVFDLEAEIGGTSLSRDLLILLTTSDMSFLQDDGLSFNFAAREDEQNEFIEAFKRSNYRNKVLIDVTLRDQITGASKGVYAPAASILKAVLELGLHGFEHRICFFEDYSGVHIQSNQTTI